MLGWNKGSTDAEAPKTEKHGWLNHSRGVRPRASRESMDPAAKSRASGVYATGTDPVQMRAILEHHLRVPGGPPFEVVRCRPSFTRGRGSRSLFQYDVTLRDPDGREWNELVSGVSYGGQRTRRAWEKLNAPARTAEVSSNIRRAAYVPDLDLLLQVFPFRPWAASIGAADGRDAGRDCAPRSWLDSAPASGASTSGSPSPSATESIFAPPSSSPSGPLSPGPVAASERRFFAKVYGGGDQAERAWTVQRDLAVALAAASAPIRTRAFSSLPSR